MVKIRWTRKATEDIYALREFFKGHSEKYAEQLTEKIFEKAEYLEHYPEIGRIVPELDRPEIRELIFKNYRIVYYVVSSDYIDILAVHNGLRLLTGDGVKNKNREQGVKVYDLAGPIAKD